VAGVRGSFAPGAASHGVRASDPRRALQMLAAQPGAVLLIALLAVQALQVGALDVIFVALALAVLNVGDAGVGLLTSAVGLGGIVGAIAAGTLAVRGFLPLWMLRAVPLFAPLPVATIERLATVAERIEAPVGTVIIREGDPADYFYVIDSGEVDVSVGGVTVRQLGRGEFFGEIALLRDVPRTATGTARDS